CQHYFPACQVVSETDMLLTMPEHYAMMLNRQFNNRIYPFPLKSLQQLELQLYWHESADNDPPNRWLREQIARIVETLNASSEPEQVNSSSKKKRAATRSLR
ncbi:MAG TPA: hypothetical protein VFB79_09265, partial [Candidatus Angelobacter sp.]|nr:hypothetical protein [Candidatus Angelobacter sp.]